MSSAVWTIALSTQPDGNSGGGVCARTAEVDAVSANSASAAVPAMRLRIEGIVILLVANPVDPKAAAGMPMLAQTVPGLASPGALSRADAGPAPGDALRCFRAVAAGHRMLPPAGGRSSQR